MAGEKLRHAGAGFGPRTAAAASIWRAVSGLLERQALTMRQADAYPLLLAELERTAVAALIETHPLRSRPGTAPAGPGLALALLNAGMARPRDTWRAHGIKEVANGSVQG